MEFTVKPPLLALNLHSADEAAKKRLEATWAMRTIMYGFSARSEPYTFMDRTPIRA